MVWFWKLTKRGLDHNPVILGSLEVPWCSGIHMVLSPDGAWLAASTDRDTVLVQNLDHRDLMLSIRRNRIRNCPPVFSRDSRMLVIQAGDSIRLIALPADGGKPAQLQSLETHIPEILQLAVYPPLGLLQTEGAAKRKLLAALGVNGEIEWWDLSETVPARHELPSLFSTFRDSLQVIRLDSNQIHSSLDWSPGGIALLATMAETSEEFGLAAVFAIDGKDGWRPLLHRHEEKYGSSTSRSQGSLGAVTGYNVKNAGDLGVKSATWLGDEGALTLGFDGTLHAREITHLEANQFWLVATQVSCFPVENIPGHRDHPSGHHDHRSDNRDQLIGIIPERVIGIIPES